jgi:hypothetical protein
MKALRPAVVVLVVATGALLAPQRAARGAAPAGLRIAVSFPESLEKAAQDGRMLLLFSSDDAAEPRFQISETSLKTQQVFGVDVLGLKPGQEATFDATVLGYPIESLAEVPAGNYWVQALLHKYETFRMGDGRVLKLPMDRGEGQQWNRAPGNLYSTPRKLAIDPRRSDTLRIALDKVIPPIPDPPTTKYIRHERIKSERLSKFWGRDMHLGAHVLVPFGFDEHKEARYPLVINHGHFPYTFDGFREEPPDKDLKPDFSERFQWPGYNRTQQELAHQLFKDWTSPSYPRMLIVQIQHANPFYDDSYAVNSANLGPYGDAITYELIPYLEKKYRALGGGWARFMYGGSTGGWESLGAQVLYPDEYNGCYAACPDPIDFRAYTIVDIYKDQNAYFFEGPWKKVPRPGHRNYLGQLSSTLEQMNRMELVLGSKGRSGGQWDIWEAVYSPLGPDGYPARLWDRRSGDRQEGRRALARELRPLAHPAPRLGEGPGPEARRQAQPLRRGHGQLLPEQRRVPGRGVPQADEEPALRRRGPLRRPRRALLERGCDAAERDLAAALPPDVRAQDRRAAPEDGAARRRRLELEVRAVRRAGGRLSASLPRGSPPGDSWRRRRAPASSRGRT